jgi:predicted HNH restriction endonuclease
LNDDSACLLAGMLGEDVASAERERRFLEGERRAARLTRSVRSAALRIEAKRRWGPRCYCCGFSFEEFYGPRWREFAIIHHLNPLGNSTGHSRDTSVDEVRVVCANCHYILHGDDPPVRIDHLKRQIAQRWTAWSNQGVQAR